MLSEHPTLLQILRLVVAVVLFEPKKIASNVHHISSQNQRMQQTFLAVSSLLSEAHSAMVMALQMVSGIEHVPFPVSFY